MTMRRLSKELQAKSITELNEDPERLMEDLKHMKNWLTKQKHIKARTEDQWLLSFLRGCKFSLERTKEKLDLYHTIRTIAPELFGNRDSRLLEIQEVLRLGIILPLLDTKGPDTPRIFLFRMGAHNPGKYNINVVFKLLGMIADIMFNEDDQLVIAGASIVLDCKGVTLASASDMTPAFGKKVIRIFQEAYPVRINLLHFCNAPSFLIHGFKPFQQFFKEKLLKRITFHERGILNDTIPKAILPKEYGGEASTIEELIDYWTIKVESYREWFLNDAQYCTDESKRPKKPKTASDIYGIEGSFRKLNID